MEGLIDSTESSQGFGDAPGALGLPGVLGLPMGLWGCHGALGWPLGGLGAQDVIGALELLLGLSSWLGLWGYPWGRGIASEAKGSPLGLWGRP